MCLHRQVHNKRTLCLLHVQMVSTHTFAFLSSEVFSLTTREVFTYNRNPPRCERTWLLKRMGSLALIGLLHAMPNTHPK